MYKILVSNSTDIEYTLPLRKKTKDSSYLEDYVIPPCALNYELSFLSEDDFKSWYNSFITYFEGNYSIFRIGKESGHKLKKINEEVEKKAEKKRQSDVNHIANIDESQGVKVEVEKV